MLPAALFHLGKELEKITSVIQQIPIYKAQPIPKLAPLGSFPIGATGDTAQLVPEGSPGTG